MKRIYITIIVLLSMSFITIIEKRLLYDQYTLPDGYTYRNIEREFQWDTITAHLNSIDRFMERYENFGILYNYKNSRGVAGTVVGSITDEYGAVADSLKTPRWHSIPLYSAESFPKPLIYGRDGTLVAIKSTQHKTHTVINPSKPDEEWITSSKYVIPITIDRVDKVIVVDRTNQNIATLERDNKKWLVRSMNPATTGIHKPPYKRETPLGIYVIHHQVPKMFFVVDGTKRIGGYAPYATRFSGGGYIHGVPVNNPSKKDIEYSKTLGTIPLSHMCVRSATSHAKFIYEWCNKGKTIVIII